MTPLHTIRVLDLQSAREASPGHPHTSRRGRPIRTPRNTPPLSARQPAGGGVLASSASARPSSRLRPGRSLNRPGANLACQEFRPGAMERRRPQQSARGFGLSPSHYATRAGHGCMSDDPQHQLVVASVLRHHALSMCAAVHEANS